MDGFCMRPEYVFMLLLLLCFIPTRWFRLLIRLAIPDRTDRTTTTDRQKKDQVCIAATVPPCECRVRAASAHFRHVGQPMMIDPDHRKGTSHGLLEHASVYGEIRIGRSPVSPSRRCRRKRSAPHLEHRRQCGGACGPRRGTYFNRVGTEAETAAGALKANSAALAKVVDAIRSSGVEGKDLQTSGCRSSRYYRPEKPAAPTGRASSATPP